MEVELRDTLNRHWKNDKSAFGFKMLQKMGWKEDKGLGKNETGMTTAIKSKRRDEGLGLGGEALQDHAGNKAWCSTSSNFNDVLSVLKATYKTDKKEKKSKKDKPKKSIPTVSVGMKYKKFKDAKDLSTKSHADLKSILGTVPVSKPSSPTTADNTTIEENESEAEEEEVSEKKKDKKKKSKKSSR